MARMPKETTGLIRDRKKSKAVREILIRRREKETILAAFSISKLRELGPWKQTEFSFISPVAGQMKKFGSFSVITMHLACQ